MNKLLNSSRRLWPANLNALDWLILSSLALVILIPKVDFIKVAGSTTSIRVEDFVLGMLFLIWLVWIIVKRKLPEITIIHILMLLFILLGMVSTTIGIASGSVDSPLIGVLNVFRRVEYLLIFWVAYSWLSAVKMMSYIKFLLIVSVCIVMIGLLQFFAVIPMYSTWEGYSGTTLYFNQNFSFLIATFAGHYELGGYLLIMTPLALVGLLTVRGYKMKALLIALLIGYYFLLYFSYSRAAYFAVMIQMIALLVLLRRYWLSLIPLAEMGRVVWLYLTGGYSKYDYSISVVKPTVTPIATSSASVAMKPKPSGVNSTLKLGDGSEVTLDPGGAVRIDIWNNAFNHIKQSPFIGTGYSSIGTGADNQYLRTAAEIGLFGLASFMSILAVLAWKFFHAAKSTIQTITGKYLIAFISIVVGLMAQAVLIDIFDASKVAILFWFVMALGLRVVEAVQKGKAEQV